MVSILSPKLHHIKYTLYQLIHLLHSCRNGNGSMRCHRAGTGRLISVLHVLLIQMACYLRKDPLISSVWIIRISHTSAAVLHQPLIQPVSQRTAGLVKTEGSVCATEMCRDSSIMHTQKKSSFLFFFN